MLICNIRDINRVEGIPWPKKRRNSLPCTVPVCTIKEMTVFLVLLNLTPERLVQKRRLASLSYPFFVNLT